MRSISYRGIWMLAIFSLYMGISCSNVSGDAGQKIAQSAIPRESIPHASDADLAALVAANTTFALNVFPLLDTTSNNNTFFSPYSITQAFSLLAPGAHGTTLSGIEKALSFPPLRDRFNPAMNKLDFLIIGNTSGSVLRKDIQAPILKNANAVWGQEGVSILPTYLDTLAANFGAGLHLVDFIHATENSRQIINAWVEDQTNDRIKNIIPPNGVSSNTRIVLTNAIWFKAKWASEFSPRATTNRTFNNRDGSSSLVPFMSQRFTVQYAQVDGCQAVDIPYAGGNLSMLVIMPEHGYLDPFLSMLTPKVLGDISSQLAYKNLAFSMPKFTFTRASEMKKILMHLGMTDAFDSARADFSGIDGKRDLFVGAVLHQAFISVDEQGTEAAAATAIVMRAGGKPRSPDLTLTIDHPFIFLIRDRKTGLI